MKAAQWGGCGAGTTTVCLEGMTDSKHDDVRYFGRFTLQPNGMWVGLADVGGSLCTVEVAITWSDTTTVGDLWCSNGVGTPP